MPFLFFDRFNPRAGWAKRWSHAALMHAALVVVGLGQTNCNRLDKVHVTREGKGSLPARDPDDPDAPLPALFTIKVATDEEGSEIDPDQVDKLYLDQLILRSGPGQRGDDFGLLNAIEVYVEGEGLEPVMVASGGPFAKGTQEIELETTGVDISPFLYNDEILVTTRAVGRLPQEKLPIVANATFSIDVDVMEVACNR